MTVPTPRQAFWAVATTAAAALVALWLVVPSCRRVDAPKDDNAATGRDKALSNGAMRPTTVPPVTPPTHRPSSGRAKVLPKVKVGFKLVRSKTYPPKPVPGCPRCGTKVPGRGIISGEGKLLGFTLRITFTHEAEYLYRVMRAGRVLYDSPVTHDNGDIRVGHLWGRGEPHGAEFNDTMLTTLKSKRRRTKSDNRKLDLLTRIKHASRWLEPGKDLTGDGRPNLVVVRSSTGSHAHRYIDILELGTKVRRIATITVTHRDDVPDALFVDLDKDGFPEIRVQDWTYEESGPYHDYCYPGPKIVLKYKKGRFRAATQFMQRKAPGARELRERARRLRASKKIRSNWAPSELWEEMLKLVYTGNAQLARRFFDMAWPKGVKGKRRFLNVFRKRLRTSPYWPSIRKMDGAI